MEQLINVNGLSLNFNLREPKANKPTNIYVVVKCGGQQMKFATGEKVNSYQWSKKQQTPIIGENQTAADQENNIKVLNTINQIKFGYYQYFAYLCAQQETTVSKVEIIAQVKNIINQVTEMANVENLKNGNGKAPKATTLLNKAFSIYYTEVKPNAKESTKATAQTQLKAFADYCEQINKDAKSMLTQKGVNDYKAYLIKKANEQKADGAKRYDSNLQINNKGEIICRLINKVMVAHSSFSRYNINKVEFVALEEVNAKNEDKKRRPLTNAELEKIAKCDSLSDEEKEYRDLFLLECFCGYRVSDTEKLFNKELQTYKKIGENEFLLFTPKKEEQHNVKAIIWLNEQVRNILNKYENGFRFATFADEKKYARKLNAMIRRIAKKTELNTVESYINAKGEKCNDYLYNIISSHFARYTFIYKGLFEWGLSAEELKEFSGHASATMINEVYKVYSTNDKFNQANKIIEKVQQQHTQSNEQNTNKNEVIAAQAVENYELKKDNEKKSNELLERELEEEKEKIGKQILDEYSELLDDGLTEDEIIKEMGISRYFAAHYFEPITAPYFYLYGNYPSIEQYKELKRKYKSLSLAQYGEEMKSIERKS